MLPYATTNVSRPMPARDAAAAKCSALGSGCRPPDPGARREVTVEVEERGARNMPVEVEAPSRAGIGDVPAAVDEAIDHGGIST